MSINTFIETEDGSPTLFSSEFNQTYHSIHGAITESVHVFIKNGLEWYLEHNKPENVISIFEMGFGTGLNAYLTAQYAIEHQVQIEYTTIEKYPVHSNNLEEISSKIDDSDLFLALHQNTWDSPIQLNPFFSFKKIKGDLIDYHFNNPIDLIFYDAFSPSSQPELWSVAIFEKLYLSLKNNGILSTYCAKGQIKRNFKEVGFEVLALPGPIGKREMTICIKK
jgi:tRNA U34 5-methylaminomethyl-2-thiouridine-forming methyltransferase MnmC